ncbi:MAG: Filamentation induced by cAMP protein Fic [Bradyrhizobium sp.]|nr:Filamentation induced by cAMP protein Fic [Bradyrhizobium sp.]
MDRDLLKLLEAARKWKIPGGTAEQRRSFAFGNGNIDRDSFSHATMSVLVPSRRDPGETDSGATLSAPPIIHRHNVEGALRQVDVAIDLIRKFTQPSAPRFELNSQMILDLHDALREDGEGGGFRTGDVTINESPHDPVGPDAILAELDDMCAEVNRSWSGRDALDLAAFVLWRLNWIHPFADGNGRTARALSYVVLNVRLGGLVPGTPTIPEQLLHQRADYLDALARADSSTSGGLPDLGPLRTLLGHMLRRQLGALPALSAEDVRGIEEMVARRLSNVRRGGVTSVFGHHAVEHRLWSLNDHIVLQLGPDAAIDEAEQRHAEQEHPFPRLLSTDGGAANRLVPASQRGIIIRDRPLLADEGYALRFEHNAAAIVEHPNVQWSDGPGRSGWSAIGALYVLRFGRELTSSWVADTLDLLLARHIADLNP